MEKYKFEEQEMLRNNPDKSYVDAYRKMKRIKGFYTHLVIFIIVNTFLIAVKYTQTASNGEEFWHWQTFSTALFWGIGLAGHGLSVFSRDFFFGKGWEERKIQQYLKDSNQNKWE